VLEWWPRKRWCWPSIHASSQHLPPALSDGILEYPRWMHMGNLARVWALSITLLWTTAPWIYLSTEVWPPETWTQGECTDPGNRFGFAFEQQTPGSLDLELSLWVVLNSVRTQSLTLWTPCLGGGTQLEGNWVRLSNIHDHNHWAAVYVKMGIKWSELEQVWRLEEGKKEEGYLRWTPYVCIVLSTVGRQLVREPVPCAQAEMRGQVLSWKVVGCFQSIIPLALFKSY
jgi:hypothetical protein